MLITSALYIALGLSLGVGMTLIYLQERFVRERRKLLALSESEKAKCRQMLKELDAKWEQETVDAKKEIEEARQTIASLEESARAWEKKSVELEEQIAVHAEGAGKDSGTGEREEFEESLHKMAEEHAALLKEKKELTDSYTEARQEISGLHGEIDFLKGNIARLEAEQKNKEHDDDYFVLAPGNHVIPGSVARALMKKKE